MVLSFLVFSVLAASGSNLVLLFSGLGGLSGLAALATVYVNYKFGSKKSEQDDKSVAIVELEKAVPGLGEIIKEWQSVVHQLQEDLRAARADLSLCQVELAECKTRVTELEGKSA